jgi:hypothetical protein
LFGMIDKLAGDTTKDSFTSAAGLYTASPD